jgi:hypothetical protein
MYGDQKLQAQIQEYEGRLKREESKYIEAVRARKSYDTLKAIRNDIRDIKQELQALYTMRDESM